MHYWSFLFDDYWCFLIDAWWLFSPDANNTLDKYLSGQNVQPGVENAVKIAKALGVTVEVLLGIEKNTNRNLPEYQSLIEQYKSLNAFNKRTVQDLIKSLSDRQ